MNFRKNLLFFLGVAAMVILLDVFSKRFTVENIPPIFSYRYPYGGIAVFHDFLGVDFSLNHATNTGAAWGIFSNYKNALLLFRAVLITGMLGYLLFFQMPRLRRLAFSLVVAGAFGNVLDHLFYGHVIDMFHFSFANYHFPVFNIADVFISMGVMYLIYEGFFVKPKAAAPSPTPAS